MQKLLWLPIRTHGFSGTVPDYAKFVRHSSKVSNHPHFCNLWSVALLALLVCGKDIGLEENADKTKYKVMSRNQNAGRIHNLMLANSSSEMAERFRYFGTTLTNQNSIQEEIKSRLESENVCYHSVQKLLSSSLLSENLKIKIYRTIISLLFRMGVKLGRSHGGRNVGWECLIIRCLWEYLGLRGKKQQTNGENYITRG